MSLHVSINLDCFRLPALAACFFSEDSCSKASPFATEAEEMMECIQEFPEHYKVILDRLNEQREQDQFTDITLIVDGHHFKAHKAVLAACSQFFYKFFQDFTQEPLVEIEGVSNMAFRHLIEFTYTAKLMVQGEEEANDVWKAAEYLQMLEAIKALEIRFIHLQIPASVLTGEKPFECPNCHERFARNSTLKCHLTACQSGAGAKKGRKKLYECQVCNSVFNSWDQFKDHLVIHTGDKPNHCTLCDLWFMQGSELRRHLKEMHNISERIVTEEVLPVEAEPVTSMTIIEQVEQVHVLPVIQVQVDPAQVTVEQMHQDLVQDDQVKGTQMDELQEQVQISYLEVERIQTEQGAEVHVEQLHVEHVNQIQMEVLAELIDGTDLEQVEYESIDQGEAEEKETSQVDDKKNHEQAEDLKTPQLVDTQNEKMDD
ncbi:zinc finger protein 131-like [Falco rusticolus]|uniref:zinc finger protein 131-like n=1 Tax=Falco rusticolus TaxID=120794 RepID=UPI00188699D6|nr:zinc finger protein 131-like [Falco rusticolus]